MKKSKLIYIFTILIFFTLNIKLCCYNWDKQDTLALQLANTVYLNTILEKRIFREGTNNQLNSININEFKYVYLKWNLFSNLNLSNCIYKTIDSPEFLKHKIRFYNFADNSYNVGNYVFAIDTNFRFYYLKEFKFINLNSFFNDHIKFEEKELYDFSIFIVNNLIHNYAVGNEIIDNNNINQYKEEYSKVKPIKIIKKMNRFSFEIYSIEPHYKWVYKNIITFNSKKECKYSKQVITKGEKHSFL